MVKKHQYKRPQLRKKKIRLSVYARRGRVSDSFDMLTQSEVLLAQSTCGSSCFLSDTKILMADGRHKSIVNIKVGESVFSYNHRLQKLVKNKVKEKLIHPYTQGYYIINKVLKATANHPFYVNGREWKSLGKVSLTDHLLNVKGEAVFIRSIDRVEKSCTSYNLHLQNKEHNFYAEDILVHNGGAVSWDTK